MGITVGDVVFSKDGRPVLVTSKDEKSGHLTINKEFSDVQAAAKQGIVNGLPEKEKQAFNAELSAVENADVRKEIDALAKRLDELRKQGNVQPRLLRYLESELQHRMHREGYSPKSLNVDPATLMSA